MPLPLWWLLAACDLRERTPLVTPASLVLPGDAIAFEAVPATGPVPLEAWVRAVNGFGASVAVETGSVIVDGNPRFLPFDQLGYGTMSFDTIGRASVTAAISADIEATPPSLSLVGRLPAAGAPAAVDRIDAALVTDGAVVLTPSGLWWSDLEGRRPHRVLAPPEPLLGMRVGHADVDALLDVITWTASTVFVLRARQGGGLAWGAAWTASGYTVAGADLGDLSADNLPDVAIAWVGGGDPPGQLDVWNGDGEYGFVASEPRNLVATPSSLIIANNGGFDRPQVTVLHADSSWSRYMEGAPGRYMPIGPRTPKNIQATPGSSLVVGVDLNGDGGDELVVAEPLAPDALRDVLVYDLVTSGLSALPIEDEPGSWVARGDGDGNLIDDLWLTRNDGIVQAIHFDPQPVVGAPTYPRTIVLRDAPGWGPIQVADRDGDGDNDLWLGAPDLWWWFRGREVPYDPASFWEPRPAEDTFVREELTGPFALAALDASPAIEVVGFTRESGPLELTVVAWNHDDVRAARLGTLPLTGRDPIDLAVCGTTAYALTDATLHSVELGNPAAPASVGSLPVVGGRGIACGAGPNGAAVALVNGVDVLLFGRGLTEVGRAPAAGAYAVGFVDLGAGPEARTCDVEGCAVAAWAASDGTRGVIVGDPRQVVYFDAAGVGTSLGGRASDLSTRDLDGDGRLELVSFDAATGLVGVYSDIGGRPSRPQLWHDPAGWSSVQWHDADLDGTIDLWGLDPDGDLRYTHPERPAATTTTATATPDTGSAHTGDGHTGDEHTGDTGASSPAR